MKLSEVCRLCLIKSSVNSDELFLPINEIFEKKFNEIANNKVSFAKAKNAEEQQTFPNACCISCINELDQHYNYKNGLIERQKQLNTLLGINEEIRELNEPQKETIPAQIQSTDQQEVQEEIIKAETREVESVSYELNDADESDNDDVDHQIMKTEKTSSDHIADFGVSYESYEQTEDQTEDEARDFEYIDYSEADEDYTEVDLNEEDLEATVDQLEEDELICTIDKSADETDSDYVVYEEDIVMEEESTISLVKRKYSKKSKDSPNQFKCWVKSCGASFSFRATMRKHMQQNHEITCDKSTCFICGKRYDSYPDFLAHMKSHTRKAQCDVCKLTFVDEEKLKKHTMRVHVKNDDDERNFQCHVSFHRTIKQTGG